MLDQVLERFFVFIQTIIIIKANLLPSDYILEKSTGIEEEKPDIVLVHGDTTTLNSFGEAFYMGISKWREAGLRLLIFKALIWRSLTVKLLP